MDYSLCSLNYLTRRYSDKNRLQYLPDFYSLPDEQHASDYIGGFSLWRWKDNNDMPEFIDYVNKDYKVQHVSIHAEKLLVAGTNFIEIYPLCGPYLEPIKTITHPWFAGGHTVEINTEGEILVSCSGSDSILFFDFDGKLLRHFRIPESIYGKNYDLSYSHDIRNHYINNDLQLGHINSATPFDTGYLCSLLIQGAIGFFDHEGEYTELIRGFVGCHGARAIDAETIYFSDSCNGLLIEIDFKGNIKRRFKINSVWLHDAINIDDRMYLFSNSNENILELWNIESGEQAWEIDCCEFGATTQFLSVAKT